MNCYPCHTYSALHVYGMKNRWNCLILTTRAFPVSATQMAPSALQPAFKIGDLCPECGQAAVVNEEGCRKCYACGYSEC